jgi:hypothetical protein
MKYTKPEVIVLGEAGYVIQQLQKGNAEIESEQANPAYDLDE